MNLHHLDSPAAWIATLADLWHDWLGLNPRLRQCRSAGNTPFLPKDSSVRCGLIYG